jgi:hypothetical protein
MRTERQSNHWAPWWVYVLVIVPVNLGKQQLLPDAAWWLVVASTAATVLVGIAVISAVYRASTALGAPGGR